MLEVNCRPALPIKKRKDSISLFTKSIHDGLFKPHSSKNELLAALALVKVARSPPKSCIVVKSKTKTITSSSLSLPEAVHVLGSECKDMKLKSEAVGQDTRDSLCRPVMLIGIDYSRDQQRLSAVHQDEKVPPQRKNLTKPPLRLTQPLPGGCHARTPRYKSYCRRRCYHQSSKFCKLHYHQFVAATKSVAVPPTDSTSPKTKTMDASISDSSSEESGGESLAGKSSLVRLLPRLQDRRFNAKHHCNTDGVRCFATSTRGRLCPYVSVGDTKYCYMHADYDANPPPKRRRRDWRSNEDGATLCVEIKPNTESAWSPLSCSLPTEGASVSTGAPRLNSVPSETWLNRKVVLAIGPMAGETGVVEKWGHGWVSVRLHTTLSLNRRSCDLCLVVHAENNNSGTAHREEELDLEKV